MRSASRVEPGRPGLVKQGGVLRSDFWLAVGDEHVVVRHHERASSERSPHAVVLCPPIGHEYTHAHRTIVHAADALAVSGVSTYRLDYPGTGNSSGSEATADLVSLWLDSLESLVSFAERDVGAGNVSLLGMRLGGTLAGTLARRRPVRHLILWHPFPKGRRFAREQSAHQKLATDTTEALEGYLDVGGFPIANATLDDVRTLDIVSEPLRITGDALLIQRADLTPDESVPAALDQGGVATTVLSQDDYMDMVAEPQYNRVPAEVVGSIVEWLGSRTVLASPDGAGDHEASHHPDAVAERRPVAASFGDVTEELVRIPTASGAELVGILCGPREGAAAGVLLMPNAGSVHHVGPNRLYVELARAAAEEGVASIRFDLRNLGDSRGGEASVENHPYPSTAVEDVDVVARWLTRERGYDRLVVTGLCSGAYTAFRAGIALEDHPVAGSISINPLTFRWRDGMSLDTPDTHRHAVDTTYYGQAVRNRVKWLRLLRGESNIRYIVRFVASQIVNQLRHVGRAILAPFGLQTKLPLEEDLSRFQAMGRQVRFVFSSSDPGYAILLDNGRPTLGVLQRCGVLDITVVAGGDHTFSKKAWRDVAIQEVLLHVRSLLALQ